jgi:hypothetical protein
MRVKRGVLIGVFIFMVVVLVGIGFYYTGRVGLVRLYRNYLSQDIVDKKYSWQDFTERGAEQGIRKVSSDSHLEGDCHFLV